MLSSEELDFDGAPAAADLHLNRASGVQNAIIVENQVHSNGTTQVPGCVSRERLE